MAQSQTNTFSHFLSLSGTKKTFSHISQFLFFLLGNVAEIQDDSTLGWELEKTSANVTTFSDETGSLLICKMVGPFHHRSKFESFDGHNPIEAIAAQFSLVL